MLDSLKNRTLRLLRWSEQYTKTDMLYLTRGGFWLGIGHIVSTAMSFLLSLAFANLLSPTTYGVYKFILSLADIIGSFSLTGITIAISRAVARGNRAALRSGFYSYLKWSFIPILLSVGVASYYLWNENPTIGFGVLIGGFGMVIWKASALYTNYLEGIRDFRKQTVIGVTVGIFATVAMLFVLVLSDNVLILLSTYILSYALINLFFFFAIARTLPRGRDPEARENERYSYHVSFLSLLGNAALQLDKVLLFHFLGASAVASYVIAQAPVVHLSKLVRGPLRSLAFPKLVSTPLQILQETVLGKVLLLGFVYAIIMLAYIFAAPTIFGVLFPTYTSAVLYSQFFALTLLLAPTMLYRQTLYAHAREYELYVVRISIALIRMILFATLIPFFGIWGAVVGYVLSSAVESAVLIGTFYRMR